MPKWLIWVVCVVVGLGLAGGGFAAGKYYQNKKNDDAKAVATGVNSNANANTNANANINTNSKTTNSNSNSAASAYAGWSTYTNSKGNYTIKYPAGGKTELVDTGITNDNICVKISTDYIYAIIATGSQDDQTMCLRAGLGEDWSKVASIKATILGKEYTLTGMGSQSASAGNHDEIFSGSLDSGEGLSLGVSVNEKYDANGTKFADKKAEMIKMIQSFAHIK